LTEDRVLSIFIFFFISFYRLKCWEGGGTVRDELVLCVLFFRC